MATRRVICRFCGRRVRVGVTGRIYRHNAPNGVCTGSWVKAPPPDDEMLTLANVQKWQDMNAKTGG